MQKRTLKLVLFLIAVILIAVNYNWLNGYVVKEFGSLDSAGSFQEGVFVKRIVDGDTIDTSIGKVRLLGINTPEKGEKWYGEAKSFLVGEIENKTVKLEFGKDKIDLYNRTLAYVFLGEKNINLEIVKNGFANYYFPEGKNVLHYGEFKDAWIECMNRGLKYCELSKSKCGSECVKLAGLDVGKQEVILYNNCDFSCNLNKWGIKDEGRKIFSFSDKNIPAKSTLRIIANNDKNLRNTENTLYWKNYDYVWTKSGDSLFLRDDLGRLVVFYSY